MFGASVSDGLLQEWGAMRGAGRGSAAHLLRVRGWVDRASVRWKSDMHGDVLPERRDVFAGDGGRRVDVSMRRGMDGGDMRDGTDDNVGAICVRSDCDCSGIGSGSGSADIAAGETISVTTVHKGCESGHSRQ